MPRKAANVPANETAKQRFVRLINGRMKTVSQNLKAIGALGKTDTYESDAVQRKKVEEALNTWTRRAIEQLNKGGEEAPDFKL